MAHKKRLEELHNESLQKVEEYLQTKDQLGEKEKEKIDHAKKELQLAWNKLLEALLYLERIEI